MANSIMQKREIIEHKFIALHFQNDNIVNFNINVIFFSNIQRGFPFNRNQSRLCIIRIDVRTIGAVNRDPASLCNEANNFITWNPVAASR